MKTVTREWTCWSDEDGEPWAVFLYGHDHDLRTLRSLNCKAEMKKAYEHWCSDAEHWFDGNLNVGRWWIRDAVSEGDEDAHPDHPWHFCEKGDSGAVAITGAKF